MLYWYELYLMGFIGHIIFCRRAYYQIFLNFFKQ